MEDHLEDARPPKSGKREVALVMGTALIGLLGWTGLMIWRDQLEQAERMIDLVEVTIWPVTLCIGAAFGQHSWQTQGPGRFGPRMRPPRGEEERR